MDKLILELELSKSNLPSDMCLDMDTPISDESVMIKTPKSTMVCNLVFPFYTLSESYLNRILICFESSEVVDQ
jgi:hypothetical protein